MTIELPSLLAFDRKLETADALMFSGNWEDIKPTDQMEWQPIAILPRKNRSTQSAEGISDDKKTKPNPVAAENDDANLPMQHDTLKVSFTVRVIGDLGKPFACNSPDFEKAIVNQVNNFKQSDALMSLAHRYAQNIANGRFLWRNRVSAESILIRVKTNRSSDVFDFNAYDYGLNTFDSAPKSKGLISLAKAIHDALAGSNDFVLITVDAFVKLGKGQHVFPSQEMNMGEKRKALFTIDKQAAMHNVKIGNALRTVDDWYPDAIFPIAAEPYGAVTQRGEAYRKSKNDLYTLMTKWINGQSIAGQESYIVANLIRGGVFSKGGGE